MKELQNHTGIYLSYKQKMGKHENRKNCFDVLLRLSCLLLQTIETGF